MPNALDYLSQVKTLAQQASDTITAALPDGAVEGVYTIESDAQLLLWGNEAQNRLARLVMPIYDSATATPQSAGATVLSPMPSIISPSNRSLTIPTQVFLGSKQMRPASVGYISNARWYPPTIDGNPTAWSWTLTAISLSNYTTQPTFTVNGYFLPVPIKFATNGATTAGTTLTIVDPPAVVEPSEPIAIGLDQVYIAGGSTVAGNYTIVGQTSSTVYTLSSAPGDSSGNVSVATPLDVYIDDFAYLTMVYYGLMKLGMKNQDNSTLSERTVPGMNAWAQNMKEIYARLIQNDNALSSIFVPTALDAAVNLVIQKSPRT